jgi:hypothetical protein
MDYMSISEIKCESFDGFERACPAIESVAFEEISAQE